MWQIVQFHLVKYLKMYITSVNWESIETEYLLILLAEHKTWNAESAWRNPLYLRCGTHHTNPTALQLSCSISRVTIAKWVPIEGRDGTRGKWHGSPPPVEGPGWQMVYFHLLRMLIGSLGRGEMGNTIHTGISAPDTRLSESFADMSTKLSSKSRRETDRQGGRQVIGLAKGNTMPRGTVNETHT